MADHDTVEDDDDDDDDLAILIQMVQRRMILLFPRPSSSSGTPPKLTGRPTKKDKNPDSTKKNKISYQTHTPNGRPFHRAGLETSTSKHGGHNWGVRSFDNDGYAATAYAQRNETEPAALSYVASSLLVGWVCRGSHPHCNAATRWPMMKAKEKKSGRLCVDRTHTHGEHNSRKQQPSSRSSVESDNDGRFPG
jgi:hypothetical protein